MKWGIVYNLHTKKAVSLAKEAYDFLKEDGEIFLERKFSKQDKIKEYSLSEINDNSDVIVTIGGDGTILRALEKVEKPVFAINSGGMGFLTEVESKYAKEGLQQVINGKYNTEKRAKIKLMVDGKRLPDAVNEVTVQTSRIAKIIYLQVLIEGELLETFGADGVIIATPTGSTSYSLSAGGPILDRGVNAMVITPLAPFKLAARPWVVPLEKEIQIRLLHKSKGSKIVTDGESPMDVTPDSKIVITGSEKKARFIRFGESFYQMVRLKLIR